MKRILVVSMGLLFLLAACSKSDKGHFKDLRQLVYFGANQISNSFLSATYVPSKKKKAAPTIVGDFVLALSAGDCELAIKSTTGRAKEMVQASIDSGCLPYATIIRSMNCDIDESGDTAKCACEEERDGMSMTFIYELQFVKKKWKIEYYEKDMDGFGVEEEESEE